MAPPNPVPVSTVLIYKLTTTNQPTLGDTNENQTNPGTRCADENTPVHRREIPNPSVCASVCDGHCQNL
jgi:hypothetical protein